jgi:hypothetical protein
LLNEVQCYLYSSTEAKPGKINSKSNIDDDGFGRERVIFNPKKVGETKTIQLGKTDEVKDGTFTLSMKFHSELSMKFHSEEFWTGKFERHPYIMRLTFLFVDGAQVEVPVSSQPFIIDL